MPTKLVDGTIYPGTLEEYINEGQGKLAAAIAAGLRGDEKPTRICLSGFIRHPDGWLRPINPPGY